MYAYVAWLYMFQQLQFCTCANNDLNVPLDAAQFSGKKHRIESLKKRSHKELRPNRICLSSDEIGTFFSIKWSLNSFKRSERHHAFVMSFIYIYLDLSFVCLVCVCVCVCVCVWVCVCVCVCVLQNGAFTFSNGS